ncbi:ATP-binding protein [Streptomyces sp. NPDC001493]
MSSIERDPRHVGGQRASVAGRLARWGVDEDRTAEVVLAVSELLTNAVLHGSADTVGLSVWCTQDEVCVEVDDRTPGTWPARACPADDDENGRGLFLVKALSTTWGISEDGAVVWCTVATGTTPRPYTMAPSAPSTPTTGRTT